VRGPGGARLIGQDPLGVLGCFGQEIVSGAENSDQQQVEVGVHRGPQGRRWRLSTADFDLPAYVTLPPTGPSPAVKRLI